MAAWRRAIRSRGSFAGESAVANEAHSSAILADDARTRSRKGQALEVSAFLFLIVPSTIVSLFTVGQWNQGFVLTASSVILRDLALCSLVFFFLWRNAESPRAIGWTLRNWPGQVALGIVSFPLMFLGAMLTAWLFLKMGLSAPHSALRSVLSVRSWSQAPLAMLLVAVVAVTEETIFRGYLLLRFKAVCRSTPVAVVLSTLVFTMGHSYEGGVGLATVALLGFFFALVYLRTGSLVAPMVLHFLQDFVGVVAVPLLTGGQMK